MSAIVVVVIVTFSLVALALAIRGSLRRDAEFKRRYTEASAEERVKLEPMRPSSTSWFWLNYYSTSQRWIAAGVIAIMVCWAVMLVLKWNGL